MILLAQGRAREAAEKLVVGMRIHPRAPHILPLLAYLAARRGDLEDARALEARAREAQRAYARCFLALDPDWSVTARAKPPHDVLGKALMLELDLEKCLPAEPTRGAKLRRRGVERLARGELEGALADAERALGDDPADGSARLLRTQAFFRLGHLEAARTDLHLIGRLAPNREADVEAIRRELDATPR